MHELSIACSIVDTVIENLPDANSRPTRIYLKIGALSGVVRDALLFSFDVATADTRAAGATLEIEEVPVIIHCADCDLDTTLDGVPIFKCGKCGGLTGDIRQGKEMEIVSFEVEDGKSADC